MDEIIQAISEGLDIIYTTSAKRADLEAKWCKKGDEGMDLPAQISVYWAGTVARVDIKGLR